MCETFLWNTEVIRHRSSDNPNGLNPGLLLDHAFTGVCWVAQMFKPAQAPAPDSQIVDSHNAYDSKEALQMQLDKVNAGSFQSGSLTSRLLGLRQALICSCSTDPSCVKRVILAIERLWHRHSSQATHSEPFTLVDF